MPNESPALGVARGEAAPITVEGWYASHRLFAIDRPAARRLDPRAREALAAGATAALDAELSPNGEGWSAAARLVGSGADLMLLHFRPTLDAIGDAERRLAATPLFDLLRPTSVFLSVTEAGLYGLSAELAEGEDLQARVEIERARPHVRQRLYPQRSEALPYVCFYPMSKRRTADQNWYALPIAERAALMRAHGVTGRRFAGRVSQVITGAIGLDVWEWGVTLFAADPLDFKRLVTEMRFDAVSARYAEFGPFAVGRVVDAHTWVADVLE